MNKQLFLLPLAAFLAGISACHHPDEMLSNAEAQLVPTKVLQQSTTSTDYYPNGKEKRGSFARKYLHKSRYQRFK